MENVSVHVLSQLSNEQRARLLRRTESDLSAFLDVVKPIVADVQERGDAALVDYALKLDKASIGIETIAVSPSEFDRAFDLVDKETIAAIEYGIENIKSFHVAQKPDEFWLKEIRPGAFAGERVTPIDTVALYVPRGKGSFPSTVMMLCVPAVVAEVPRAYILTPPGPDGTVDPATLVVAKLAGVREVFRAGGAQAVAAAAFGTKTIPRADKIIGPGSPWVVAAKRALSHVIDPGIPAGPSESIIFVDSSGDPRLAAMDLLIEAEHGPDSSAFLVTTCDKIATEALIWLKRLVSELSPQRAEFVSNVLQGQQGGIVIAGDENEAFDFINDYGPEHLEVLSDEPFEYLRKIRNAGEILLGSRTPLSIANFVLGPNAVLPTDGRAKTVSALSVHDFLKRSSVGFITSKGFEPMAKMGYQLAKYEGFDAHALSLSGVRTELLNSK